MHNGQILSELLLAGRLHLAECKTQLISHSITVVYILRVCKAIVQERLDPPPLPPLTTKLKIIIWSGEQWSSWSCRLLLQLRSCINSSCILWQTMKHQNCTTELALGEQSCIMATSSFIASNFTDSSVILLDFEHDY